MNLIKNKTALALAMLCPACQVPEVDQARVERRLAMMGTELHLVVFGTDRSQALMASEAAVRALESTEQRLSTWREQSELSRLNRSAVEAETAISPELHQDLMQVREWSRRLDGAFDPTLAPLVELWQLRRGGRNRLPSPEALHQALQACGLGHWQPRDGHWKRLHPQAGWEEGAFGKGIGLDRALAALEAAGASQGEINLGGQIALLAETEATLQVADPRDRLLPVVELNLQGGSLATTGNSERGIQVAGRSMGHVLDPRTGKPAPDFGSLTVWAASATDADCLSTGLYVLGADAALQWAEKVAGVEVLVLEKPIPGSPTQALSLRYSSGLTDRIRVLLPDAMEG